MSRIYYILYSIVLLRVRNRVFIPHMSLLTTTDSGFPFNWKRKQFPGRPAFCISINKGGGQNLETVDIFYSSEATFFNGQIYVALSRVQVPRSLNIIVCGGKKCRRGVSAKREAFAVQQGSDLFIFAGYIDFIFSLHPCLIAC